jgi:hypothetical protein
VLEEEPHQVEVASPHLRAVEALEEEVVPLLGEEVIHFPTRSYLQLSIVVSQDNLS